MYYFTFGEFVNGTEYEKLIKEIFEDMKEKKAYEQGLEDAWEAARKCLNNNALWSFCDLDPGESMFSKYSAARAIEKIKAYEEERTKIKVGDEVVYQYKYREKTGVVYDVMNFSDGNVYQIFSPFELYTTDSFNSGIDGIIRKTGRHFPQVEELLKAMKEK